MEAIKLKTHINHHGLLSIQLPIEAYGQDCEVIILYEPRRQMTPTEWRNFVNETYGSLADNPIELDDDLPLEDRDSIE